MGEKKIFKVHTGYFTDQTKHREIRATLAAARRSTQVQITNELLGISPPCLPEKHDPICVTAHACYKNERNVRKSSISDAAPQQAMVLEEGTSAGVLMRILPSWTESQSVTRGKTKIVNRDTNAAKNMRRIGIAYMELDGHPDHGPPPLRLPTKCK
ncbi:hypothetical protein BJV82DRAFT_686410 [Fennellomyces sp. T-0311]|nr:hypothetical protein BJV82DRAFT_686410 [Fennellomyces sp. T-0311]